MWTSTSKVIQSNEVQKEKIQLDLDFPKSITTSSFMYGCGRKDDAVHKHMALRPVALAPTMLEDARVRLKRNSLGLGVCSARRGCCNRR
jgi:hypothetical protein